MIEVLQVMDIVKRLTTSNDSITVCATIHSPSPQTFNLFDKIIILLSGRIVYFGDNGNPTFKHEILTGWEYASVFYLVDLFCPL
jgi:ABC-type multidrug transport system ATPase subunit